MLDKVAAKPKKKTPFEQWWGGLPLNIRATHDLAFARRCFRAGHLIGTRPAKIKYRFRAGRFQVSVWASNAKDAAKEAVIELDFRVANAGKKPPRAGWKLTPIRDDE